MPQIRDLAEKTARTIIGLRHLNKSSNQKALYRGSGHIAFAGAARAVLIIGQDPDNDDGRVMAVSKCNLAAKPASLRFHLEPQPSGMCRVIWEGACSLTADDLVTQPPTQEEKEEKAEAHSKLQLAEELLAVMLHEGPKELAACKQEAARAGIPTRTLERAAKNLGITLHYNADSGQRVYYWQMPGG